MNIPVVDFGAYRLSEKDVADEQWQSLSTELESAFRDVGFAFLKNTGITQEEVRPVRYNQIIIEEPTLESVFFFWCVWTGGLCHGHIQEILPAAR